MKTIETKLKNPYTSEVIYKYHKEHATDDVVRELASINVKLWVIIFVFVFLPLIKSILEDIF